MRIIKTALLVALVSLLALGFALAIACDDNDDDDDDDDTEGSIWYDDDYQDNDNMPRDDDSENGVNDDSIGDTDDDTDFPHPDDDSGYGGWCDFPCWYFFDYCWIVYPLGYCDDGCCYDPFGWF